METQKFPNYAVVTASVKVNSFLLELVIQKEIPLKYINCHWQERVIWGTRTKYMRQLPRDGSSWLRFVLFLCRLFLIIFCSHDFHQQHVGQKDNMWSNYWVRKVIWFLFFDGPLTFTLTSYIKQRNDINMDYDDYYSVHQKECLICSNSNPEFHQF